ncbi:hypothetical protein E1A91_D05G089800v1 [Gossypium mustelinum]|uniref:Uncharacterized protein n=1 Tax=Gossypium mustelinum TaxID=34275 RepID=A0A5D2UUH0_GOSMU|nr:hypothetical protein E1A91_D05G089800v1 [Gossypium mustelinum]
MQEKYIVASIFTLFLRMVLVLSQSSNSVLTFTQLQRTKQKWMWNPI